MSNLNRTLARLMLEPGSYTVKGEVVGFQRGAAFQPWNPTGSWADCGPLIERYEVELARYVRHSEDGGGPWTAITAGFYAYADDPREAVVQVIIDRLAAERAEQ